MAKYLTEAQKKKLNLIRPHLSREQLDELDAAYQEVLERESGPAVRVGSHAMLVMVVIKITRIPGSVGKQEAKGIAEYLLGYA